MELFGIYIMGLVIATILLIIYNDYKQRWDVSFLTLEYTDGMIFRDGVVVILSIYIIFLAYIGFVNSFINIAMAAPITMVIAIFGLAKSFGNILDFVKLRKDLKEMMLQEEIKAFVDNFQKEETKKRENKQCLLQKGQL